jgi:hypothetical protein
MAKVTDDTNKMFKQMSELPQSVAKQAYEYFVSITPKRSGNARRSTRLQKTTIDANYNYASDLDDGKSKQAPSGMSEPTIKKLNGFLDTEVKKIK